MEGNGRHDFMLLYYYYMLLSPCPFFNNWTIVITAVFAILILTIHSFKAAFPFPVKQNVVTLLLAGAGGGQWESWLPNTRILIHDTPETSVSRTHSNPASRPLTAWIEPRTIFTDPPINILVCDLVIGLEILSTIMRDNARIFSQTTRCGISHYWKDKDTYSNAFLWVSRSGINVLKLVIFHCCCKLNFALTLTEEQTQNFSAQTALYVIHRHLRDSLSPWICRYQLEQNSDRSQSHITCTDRCRYAVARQREGQGDCWIMLRGGPTHIPTIVRFGRPRLRWIKTRHCACSEPCRCRQRRIVPL